MTNPYEYVDTLTPALGREIQLILSNASLRVCSFDEVNQASVRGVVSLSFAHIFSRLSSKLRKVIRNTYKSFGIVLTKEELDARLAALLSKYDPVMGYQLKKEVPRKRDRMIEAILARPGKQDIRRSIAGQTPYILLMANQFMDTAVDDSRQDAMEREGVEKVMWISEGDNRVCPVCKERDHRIYSINQVPDKPHPRCRFWTEPVR